MYGEGLVIFILCDEAAQCENIYIIEVIMVFSYCAVAGLYCITNQNGSAYYLQE